MMSLEASPRVFVLSDNGEAVRRLRACFPESVRLTSFSSPLDLLGACIDGPMPALLVAEISVERETWVVPLQAVVELPNAPRRLMLTEAGVVEDVMHDTYRAGEDHILLWPCTDEELAVGVRYMLVPHSEGGAVIGAHA